MGSTIVLAYSGGLDTSVALKWLQLERGYDVVACSVDVGHRRTSMQCASARSRPARWPPR